MDFSILISILAVVLAQDRDEPLIDAIPNEVAFHSSFVSLGRLTRVPSDVFEYDSANHLVPQSQENLKYAYNYLPLFSILTFIDHLDSLVRRLTAYAHLETTRPFSPA